MWIHQTPSPRRTVPKVIRTSPPARIPVGTALWVGSPCTDVGGGSIHERGVPSWPYGAVRFLLPPPPFIKWSAAGFFGPGVEPVSPPAPYTCSRKAACSAASVGETLSRSYFGYPALYLLNLQPYGSLFHKITVNNATTTERLFDMNLN